MLARISLKTCLEVPNNITFTRKSMLLLSKSADHKSRILREGLGIKLNKMIKLHLPFSLMIKSSLRLRVKRIVQ